MNIEFMMEQVKKLFIPVAIVFIVAGIAASSYAVTVPLSGTSTPNGRFIYVPDMTNNRIRVFDADIATGSVPDDATANTLLVQNVAVPGDPYSIVVNSAGTVLYAAVSGSPDYVIVYSIAADGLLSQIGILQLEANASPRGCALSPDEKYLYVADVYPYADGRRLRIINVQTPTAPSETGNIKVASLNLYGVAVNPVLNRLYVSVMHSSSGQVLVYNITTSSSPSYVTSIAGCPSASFMRVTPDGTRLFVKVFQTSSPYADVQVVNTASNTIIQSLSVPSPGDHNPGIDGNSDGYADNPANQDYDTQNDNAGIDIDSSGEYLYFIHYKDISGNGMWHYSIKIRTYRISDLSNSWENNGGVGFHSADSMVVTNRNRVWLMYSDGGLVQATPTFGPNWVGHYNATSNEAVILWADTPYSSSFDIQYGVDGGSMTTINVSAASMESKLTGLTKMSLYDVRVRTHAPNGEISSWSPNLFTDPYQFYTLEQVWVSPHATATNEATVVFGPLISTGVMNVPYAVRYDLYYRVQGAPSWTAVSVTSPYDDNGTNYTAKLTGLTPFTNYEVMMRSVDSNSGVSEWSSVDSFLTIPGPTWISNYNTTTTQTYLTWEAVSGITSYEVSYGVSTEPVSWTLYENYSVPITGLSERTWYEVRGRAHTGSYASEWVYDDFFTIPAPNNVEWNGSTAITADITWEPVYLDSSNTILCTSYEVSWGISYDATGSGEVMTSDPYVTLTGLLTGQEYYVKVRARDDADNGYSDWAPYDPIRGITGLYLKATDEATVSDMNAGYGVTSAWRGSTVIIKGANFGSTTGTVSFGATAAQPGYWKNTEIAVSVPPTAVAGANSVTITTAAGKSSTAPYPFTVLDGGFVIDDFEGGVWEYATWESGGGNSVKAIINYTSPQERNAYITAECSGTAAYEIVGGVSTYGDSLTENGYDISSCKHIKLWFKGDGTSNVATFELVESNQAPGNNPAVSLEAEVWRYNVPISMSDTNWQQVTINLSTTDATGKFVMDPYYSLGNHVLDLNKIKSYQILTKGVIPNKKYAVDYIFATTEAGGAGSTNYNMHNNSNGNFNWIAFSFSGTGLNTTTDLANSVGNIIPVGSRVAWTDAVEVHTWDPVLQSESIYSCMWDGTTWNDSGSNAPLVVGAMYKVAIPAAGDGLTWNLSGSIPLSGAVSFTLRNNSNGNFNWVTIPAYSSGLNISTDLGNSVGNTIPVGSRVAWTDAVEVHTWDPVLQSESIYSCMWDGTTWNDSGSNTPVSTPGPYIVTVPSAGDGKLWP